ncbi:MAG: demethylmenaquinone methyltransferase [Firmicutes bacterium]|nr:demethylmenaquinone methyltransferase [Bacillota bacterium]
MQEIQEKYVQRIFESIALHYDRMNAVISLHKHHQWRRTTMKLMNVNPGENILDLCCGTCDWTIALATAVGPTGKVFGLDFSPSMLAMGREKIEKAHVANIELLTGNALEIPFPDNCFDVVTIGFGLRNTTDYPQVVKEMYRVLKPAGKVVCLETSVPTIPGFRQLFIFYFQIVMPFLGKVFVNNYEAYNWLQQSTIAFPSKEKLACMFAEVGFSHITYTSHTGGVVATHIGIK